MRAWSVAVALTSACTQSGAQFTISGRVAATATVRATAVAPVAPVTPRTITHVMAVDPQTSSPQRTVAPVGADGSFELSVAPGHPYVFVFVDAAAVGVDMAVAIFRADSLDTISPQLAGHLDLGNVTADDATQTATTGVAYADLIASLGLDPTTAAFLGSIDDLSLRYANPDIDGNGTIDAIEHHDFALDFHVRTDTRRGSATGASFTVADITDAFLPSDGPDVATPVFNLTSAYVEYAAGYDATEYVVTGAPATTLENGGAYAATLADGSPTSANTSFSSLAFGDTRGWGADYDFAHTPGLELPGSGGVPATLAYTLGGVGTTLTFANVVTRTRQSLSDDGTLAIFIGLATSAGTIASVDYAWMKRAAGAWVPAAASEIAVAISSDGGYVSFHRAPQWSDETGVRIPSQPSGSVAWSGAPLAPGDICGLAVSYDDKLGLRHFIGGVDPNPGVTCMP